MAGILPFTALHYNTEKVADLGKVIAPPYDRLAKNTRSRLEAANPYNIVRLTPSGRELKDGQDQVIGQATSLFRQWREQQVLISSEKPGLYYYRMGFSLADGRRTVRRGFFALLNIESDESGLVLPQQADWMKPRTDRLALLEAMRANCSPIFLLFSDPEREVMSLLSGAAGRDPLIDAEDDDDREHSVFAVTDEEIIAQVAAAMKNRTVTLADGHHRYRTAQAFAKAHPDNKRAQTILACLVPIQDEGLTVRPIHRTVVGMPSLRVDELLFELSQIFYIREMPALENPADAVSAALAEMEEQAALGEPAFAMSIAGMPGIMLLTLKSDAAKLALPDGLAAPIRDLDAALLQRLILEGTLKLDPHHRDQGNIGFFEDPYRLPALLENGEAQLVFLCNPIRHNQLEAVAEARLKLPHKVARFVPEVPAGLVLQTFDANDSHGGV